MTCLDIGADLISLARKRLASYPDVEFLVTSFEDWGKGAQPLIRRNWVSLYPNEVRRITLIDLLVEYHPIGGLVMVGDLMASYAFEQERDLAWAFDGVETLPQVFDKLLSQADNLEQSATAYDPRSYALREILTLLAAGC